MAVVRIRSKVILIGYDPRGKCVYSASLELSDYYEGQHVWDKSTSIKKLRLQKLKGFLFDSRGVLDEEFESVFDVVSGSYKTGYTRYADGTVVED